MDNKLNFIGALAVAGSIIYAATLVADASKRSDTVELLVFCSSLNFDPDNRVNYEVWFACKDWIWSDNFKSAQQTLLPAGQSKQAEDMDNIPEVPSEAFLD